MQHERKNTQDIIKRPYIAEKTTQQRGEANRYAFVVDPRANKIEIKAAIETLYKVKVSAVHVDKTQRARKSASGGAPAQPPVGRKRWLHWFRPDA